MVRLSIILVLLLAFAPDWLLHALWLVFAIGLVAAWVDRRSHRGQGDDVARPRRFHGGMQPRQRADMNHGAPSILGIHIQPRAPDRDASNCAGSARRRGQPLSPAAYSAASSRNRLRNRASTELAGQGSR